MLLPPSIAVPEQETTLQAALHGSLVNEFQHNAISLLELQDSLAQIGLEDIGHQLAYAARCAAFEHKGQLGKPCVDRDYTDAPEQLQKLKNKLSSLVGKTQSQDIAYILVAGFEPTEEGPVPGSHQYQIFGSLFNYTDQSIVASVKWHETLTDDALIAELPSLGKTLLKKLQGPLAEASSDENVETSSKAKDAEQNSIPPESEIPPKNADDGTTEPTK